MQNNNQQSQQISATRQLARDLISQTRAKRATFAQEVAKEIKASNNNVVINFPVKSYSPLVSTVIPAIPVIPVIPVIPTIPVIDEQKLFTDHLHLHALMHNLAFNQQIVREITTTKYINRFGMDLRDNREEPQGIVARMMFRCWYRKG